MKHISDDLFASWKDKKFVVAESYLHESPGHLIILTDYTFWVLYHAELLILCSQNNSKLEGMTVSLPTDQSLTAFILRWQ
jgi:hypothetical protein